MNDFMLLMEKNIENILTTVAKFPDFLEIFINFWKVSGNFQALCNPNFKLS